MKPQSDSSNRLRVLQLMLSVGETSAPYNEYTVPMQRRHRMTICSFFRANIPAPSGMSVYQGDGTLRGFYRALKAACSSEEYDVVHSHDAYTGFLFVVIKWLAAINVPKNTVFTVHSSFDLFRLKHRLMLLLVFGVFRKIAFCSHASHSSFRGVLHRLSRKKAVVVQNGVNLQRLDRIRAAVPRVVDHKPFTVIWVGRVIDIKRPQTMLKAHCLLTAQNTRLVIVGTGALSDLLRKQVDQYGLENSVILTGLVPRDQVFQHFMHADVFVSTSLTEGLPIAVLEAMACGCPAILSDIDAHREIANGVNFIPLVHPDAVQEFAAEIEKFSNMPVSVIRDIGNRCRRLVEKKFSLDAMNSRYSEVYRFKTNSWEQQIQTRIMS